LKQALVLHNIVYLWGSKLKAAKQVLIPLYLGLELAGLQLFGLNDRRKVISSFSNLLNES